jgi:hypothetical protein
MPTWVITAPTGPTSGSEIVELIESLTNWFFVGFLLLAVLFIVLAGWQFISSRAEPVALTQARSKLLWAAVAIVAAVLSRGIATVIRAIVGS